MSTPSSTTVKTKIVSATGGNKEDPEDMTVFVQSLLQQMQSRFQQMSDSIIGRIDEIGSRIDDLETSIADLMEQAGVDDAKKAGGSSSKAKAIKSGTTYLVQMSVQSDQGHREENHDLLDNLSHLSTLSLHRSTLLRAALKNPLVPHMSPSHGSRGSHSSSRSSECPVTDVVAYYEKKEIRPAKYTVCDGTYLKTTASSGKSSSNGLCRLAFLKDIEAVVADKISNLDPIEDVALVRVGSEKEAEKAGFEILRESKPGKIPVKIKLSGRLVPNYAYVAVKRQVLSSTSLLRRVGLVTDMRLNVGRIDLETDDGFQGYEACKCFGSQNRLKSDVWIYLSRGKPDGLLDLRFEPAVSDRFPVNDHEDFEFPQGIEHFCFPHGVNFVLAGEQLIPMPRWSMFVLTLGDGTRVHGANITFYEVVSNERIERLEAQYAGRLNNGVGPSTAATPTTKGRRSSTAMTLRVQRSDLYEPTAIAFLSHHSCCDALKNLLAVLYRVSLSASSFPLEHYVGHALQARVPREHRKLRLDWNGVVTEFPPVRDWEGLPSTVSFTGLFSALSIEHVLECIRLMLLDKKIVFVTKHLHQVTVVTEALRSLIFPLNWWGAYIPVCPDRMANFVRAPMPFVLGFSAESFEIDEHLLGLPDDVFVVDLDRDRVYPCRAPELRGPALSGVHVDTCARVLRKEIESRCHIHQRRTHRDVHELGFVFRGSSAAREGACLDVQLEPSSKVVRGVFLQLMCAMMRGYKSCLKLMYNLNRTGSINDMINIKRFVDYTDPSLHEFVLELVESSPFTSFVEECCQSSSRTSSKFARLYFDRCVRCFSENSLPETPEGKVAPVPDLKERLVELQNVSLIGKATAPSSAIRDRLPPLEEDVSESFKASRKQKSGAANPWQKLRSDWMPRVLKRRAKLAKQKAMFPSLILRTSDERAIGESMLGSWTRAGGRLDRKRHLDVMLADVNGAWALTVVPRVEAPAEASRRHGRLMEAIRALEDKSPTTVDQTTIRAFFEACVVSRTATRETVRRIYKCLEKKTPELPNALTYGHFSLALTRVQTFCPPNWNPAKLARQRRSSLSLGRVASGSVILPKSTTTQGKKTRRLSEMPSSSSGHVSSSSASSRLKRRGFSAVESNALAAVASKTMHDGDDESNDSENNEDERVGKIERKRRASFDEYQSRTEISAPTTQPKISGRCKSVSRITPMTLSASRPFDDALTFKELSGSFGSFRIDMNAVAQRAAGVELYMWTQSACENCGYVPMDVEVMASWSGWTPTYTSSATPVLRVGMIVEAIRNNNRLLRSIRGVPLKYCTGDTGVVVEVDGASARIKWNGSTEHVSPNWRDCVKIIDTPYPKLLFEHIREMAKLKTKSPTYVDVKWSLIEKYGEAIFTEYKSEVQTAMKNNWIHVERQRASPKTPNGKDITPKRLLRKARSVTSTFRKISSTYHCSSGEDMAAGETRSVSNTNAVAPISCKKKTNASITASNAERLLEIVDSTRTPVGDETKKKKEEEDAAEKKRRVPKGLVSRRKTKLKVVTTTVPKSPPRGYCDTFKPNKKITVTSSIPCPCCARLCVPQLHFEAKHSLSDKSSTLPTGGGVSKGSCAHMSPHDFRRRLETFMIENGSAALRTDRMLCAQDPELFYNTVYYFETFGLSPIPGDPCRPKMTAVVRWTFPRQKSTPTESGEETSLPDFMQAVIDCLKQKNVTGAVSILLLSRRDATNTVARGEAKTNAFETGLANSLGSTHVVGMSMHAILAHILLQQEMVGQFGGGGRGRLTSSRLVFDSLNTFDREYAAAVETLSESYGDEIFNLDRNMISEDFHDFVEAYRSSLRSPTRKGRARS